MLPSLAATIVAGLPDAILIATSDGSWIAANPAAVTLLGYEDGALLHLRVADIIVPDPAWAGDEQAHVLGQGRWQGAVTVRASDGRLVPVEADAIVIDGPEEPLVAWVLRESTARQEAEDLREALAVVERRLLAKGVFLDTMAHEMRTPLQAVLGYAELLLTAPSASLTDEQREEIGYILQASNRLIAIVNQALELSRMEAARITLAAEPVDLAEVVEAVRQDIAPQALSKALAVEIVLPPSLPPVLGDAERVRQILLNLAGNAVKFTDRGRVRISATTVATPGVEIVVSDTGRGIAAEELPHIFEAFHQVPDGATRQHGGSGLGLAIAARLADQMGGSIDVSSVPDVGTTFRLHLPGVPAATDR
jgi:PAS domain S-box-containing protein